MKRETHNDEDALGLLLCADSFAQEKLLGLYLRLARLTEKGGKKSNN